MEVVAVDPLDRAALKRFVRVPERLYGGDSRWIAPLRLEREEALSPRANPFFRHAQVRYWIATRGGRDVGRISAQIDRLQQEPVGHFGLLAAEDDAAVFAALFAPAETWLRERGMPEILGPFSLSVNEEAGLLVDGHDRPPALMTPWDPPWNGARVEQQGYVKAKDVHAYISDVREDFPPAIQRRLDRGPPTGVRLRRPDMRRLTDEVRIMADIVNDAWSTNWGFAPWTEAETLHLANSLRPLIDPDLVRFAEVDGEAVGFLVALPDLNAALRGLGGKLLPLGWVALMWRLKVAGVRSARVPLMGVRPAYARRPGGAILPLLLMDAVRKEGRRKGYETFESSWILEDNTRMRRLMEAMGGRLDKTWRLYRKPL